jgi:isopenicillin N synthase-like dioxygenase
MGSLTLLFRQPVAALQVLTKDGTWKYVKPQMNALTVNIADALEFLTSEFHAADYQRLCGTNDGIDGFLKSSIHRVIAPPKDQAHIDRLGVLYMVRLEDDTDLVPLKDSPVLQELGLVKDPVLGSDGKPIKAGEWVKQRIIKNLGNSTTENGDNEVGNVEIVKGVATKYYD